MTTAGRDGHGTLLARTASGADTSAADAPSRRRLLSYVGRWGRARRWLPPEARVVADVGCASGYGTAALTGAGRSRRRVIGVERDPDHLSEAARRFPWLPVVEGDAAALPFEDGSLDAVVMLDVLEHVPDPRAVVAEIRRVLSPGGALVLSVPHRGLFARLDSLNVYPALQRRFPSWQPVEPADETGPDGHRHFALEELEELFGDRFVVDRMARTGLGLAELAHLTLLVTFKGLLRWRAAYRALLPLHFLVYLLDDLVPAGPLGYHLTIRACAAPAGGAA
jgi:SAM-dependent methyltransferase